MQGHAWSFLHILLCSASRHARGNISKRLKVDLLEGFLAQLFTLDSILLEP